MMERYLKRKISLVDGGTSGQITCVNGSNGATSSTLSLPEQINSDELPWDPAERKRISDYHPNQRDAIRIKYMIRGPCQPRDHKFPQRLIGKKLRRFNPIWFAQYGTWLEYSVKADKAFCFVCYLFKEDRKQAGNDAFVTKGFGGWNKIERLACHVGGLNSFHNKALQKFDDLMRQNQSIIVASRKQDNVVKDEGHIRLDAMIDTYRQLFDQGLLYRCHYEALPKKTYENNQMVSSIQKDITHCFAQEIVKSIIEDIGDDVFGLLMDVSSDIAGREQMTSIFRYVDKYGMVKERFIGITHVMETSTSSLKDTIDCSFVQYGLNMSKVRVQSYDGTSDMRNEFNGLRDLIMKESCSAYYVHCFAHQFESVVVAVAKKHFDVGKFFDMMYILLNVVGTHCKGKDIAGRSAQEKLMQAFDDDEIIGLNQELILQRGGDTHYGSHYKTLLLLVGLFSSVVEVLEYVKMDGKEDYRGRQAYALLVYFQSFEFVFYLQLMLLVLGLTNSLSMALNRKDHDILNAISLVKTTKQVLHKIRDDGYDSLLKKVSCFCEEHDIVMINMEEEFVDLKNPRQRTHITNYHHYMVDCFYTILDMELQELDDRFNEMNSELLICIASLSPSDSFREFDPLKLMRLAEFYPNDFNFADRMILEHQLNLYFDDVREDENFSKLSGLSELARVMVDTKKHVLYDLVYRLLKLALILPIATPTIERCFTSRNIVKTNLRNQIGDQYLNDCLVSHLENDVLATITNEVVMDRFQKMNS